MRAANTGSPPAPDRPLPRVVIGPRAGAAEWLEIWRYRDLLRTLAERDIRLRYRQTVLGVFWVILQPLASSIIFATIFGNLAKLPSDGVPYLPFVFAGLLPWNLFAGSTQRAGNSLVAHAGLVTKIYFPRAIIPLASVTGSLLDFLVAGMVMVALLLLTGIGVGWSILAVPALVLLILMLAVGTGLLFSGLSVYFRDFSYALPFLLQFWMYASPVVYASSLIPAKYHVLYAINPMVGVIEGFRWALVGGPFPAVALIESLAVSSVILLIGATVFKRIERSFADVI
ncbi:MAG: ABC transporter permease [Chloroflexi bacterium]|nr:ABC transporter permease [Chloroflexota bacterium]